MAQTRHVVIKSHDDGRLVRADYHGGAYIELTFGTHDYEPVEVINVYDYEAGAPRVNIANPEILKDLVSDWIDDQDYENPDWYDDYLRYGR